MPVILLVGPFVALVGVGAIFFVLRRKSVDKRSMYSARRSQIEHKVRAARQRTLAGHDEKPAETPPEPAPSIFAPKPGAPRATYEPSAYEPPPAASPPAASPPAVKGVEASPWDVGPTAPAPSQFAVPEPAPIPEPTLEPTPSEPAWTPTPAPAEPATPVEPAREATPAAWSVVSEAKESASVGEAHPKKGKQPAPAAGAWQLASGEAPGDETDEAVKMPRQTVAIAQYAVLVVGLVAVLIGVLIMVASVPIK
jgi:hypothetical protein